MRATVIYGAGDVRVETVPDPKLGESTDAVVRVVRSCICGSDLWPYADMAPDPRGQRIGHEFLGVVEETGSDVGSVKKGDLVVAPFMFSDNTCQYCREGLHTSCPQGGMWGYKGTDGGQGEAVRVPQADGTLIKLPHTEDDGLLASLLTLSDVFSTGHHAATTARVAKGKNVTVIGDGAVGLCAVLAAKRLGAEQIVLMGRQETRTNLGREFGATDVVPERGEEGIAKVRELTNGEGTHAVLECVGTKAAFEMGMGAVRAGGAISRVGVPQYEEGPVGPRMFRRNVSVTGGVAPARAYIPELLEDVLDGTYQPGKVFDRTIGLDDVPAGYRAMAGREALKVLIA